MSIFNKTTSIDFQEFGEVFTENTFKNKFDENRFYLLVENKTTNTFYKSNNETYFTVREGITAIAVTDDLNKTPKIFVIHRICKLNPNLYFTFLTVSNRSIVEISEKNIEKTAIQTKEEVSVHSLKSTLHVKEILGDYYVVRGTNYNFPGEVLDFWEITYVDDGSLITDIDGKEYILNPQEIIFYAPGQEHNQRTTSTCSYLTIVFDMDINQKEVELLKNKIFKASQREADILSWFNKSSKEYTELTPLLLTSAVQMFIVSILSNNQSTTYKPIITKMQQKYDNELLGEIALYIQENIYSPINVEDICQRFSLSRSSIQTLFAKNLNTSPKQYISDLKFAKAKQMIKESTYSISEIARICGFSSIHYFSRVFKEKYGITPTSYAKSIS